MKGNVIRPKEKFLVESQQKFQKQMQEVLLVMRNQEEILVMAKDEASEGKSKSEEEEPITGSLKSAIEVAFEDSLFNLTLGGMPLLQKSFGEKNNQAWAECTFIRDPLH
jgi:hypothetical protein